MPVLFIRRLIYEFSSMDNDTISVSQALEIMGRRDHLGRLAPFNISHREFNATNKTGGRFRVRENVKYLPPADPDADKEETIHNLLDPVKFKKNPNHWENFTRNIELENGEIRKINLEYIITINNNTVIL